MKNRLILKVLHKTFLRVVNFTANSIPFIWVLAIGISLVEAFFYPGFIMKHTSFNPIIIYGGFLLLGLVKLFSAKLTSEISFRLFNKLSYFAIFLFGLAFVAFYLLDSFKYANYTFSTFHLHTSQLTVPLGLSAYMYIVSSKYNFLYFLGNIKSTYKLRFFLMTILLWILIPNAIDLTKLNAKNLSFLFKNPTADYNTKMEYLLGKQFYDYVLFIKANTPDNAKVLLPPYPAYPWPQTGNYAYIRYFLYPRTVLNGNEYNAGYDLSKQEIDYVLIAWGETESTSGDYTHGWPKFDVNAANIVYMVPGGGKVEKPGNYIYKDVLGQPLWGIIKVKK